MKVKNIAMVVIAVILISVVAVWAGDPTPNNPPGSTAAYTLEDLWQRLTTGVVGAQSTFTEPTAGPGMGTMHTLNEIMAAAPAVDDTDGALPGDVLAGKTYWGLQSSAWATQTGTAAIGNNVNGANGARIFDIPDGFYAGKTATANDTNLVAENIKCGVTIFGVAGIIGLPECVAKTGQTTSYGAGDDGAYQKGCEPAVGFSLSDPFGGYNRRSFACYGGIQFEDNGDGTVTDNLTGLMWAKDATLNDAKDWAAALTYCNGLKLGEYDDWRLPNINELRSLFDPSLASPYLSAEPADNPFTGVESSLYWSSTTHATYSDMAWGVSLHDGSVFGGEKQFTNSNVWPVRGGE